MGTRLKTRDHEPLALCVAKPTGPLHTESQISSISCYYIRYSIFMASKTTTCYLVLIILGCWTSPSKCKSVLLAPSNDTLTLCCCSWWFMFNFESLREKLRRMFPLLWLITLNQSPFFLKQTVILVHVQCESRNALLYYLSFNLKSTTPVFHLGLGLFL